MTTDTKDAMTVLERAGIVAAIAAGTEVSVLVSEEGQ